LNFGLLGAAILIGWFAAAVSHAQMDLRATPEIMSDGILRDFTSIAAWNLGVARTIVMGTCTFGIFSLLELLWNGLHHGFDLYVVSHSCPAVVPFFLSYAPIEISALALVASASQSFSLRAAQCLLFREPLRARSSFVLFVVGIAMLLCAALIEAHAKPTIQRVMC
jgi:uncharacterized membrane protein SpoIIM required for sporulation